ERSRHHVAQVTRSTARPTRRRPIAGAARHASRPSRESRGIRILPGGRIRVGWPGAESRPPPPHSFRTRSAFGLPGLPPRFLDGSGASPMRGRLEFAARVVLLAFVLLTAGVGTSARAWGEEGGVDSPSSSVSSSDSSSAAGETQPVPHILWSTPFVL